MSFNKLSDIESREVIKGFKAKFVHTEHVTLAFWEIEAGSELPEHHHIHEQISNMISGKFELTMEGETHVMEPGKTAIIKPDVPHSGRAITDCEILDIFSPVREDYK
ncbi:MAG: cupin domain-containing protein [Bacteroidetes bacterium]|nr:cupin domain-containing protein [Bacteroidota bacterium]